jgi:hypothetical protein
MIAIDLFPKPTIHASYALKCSFFLNTLHDAYYRRLHGLKLNCDIGGQVGRTGNVLTLCSTFKEDEGMGILQSLVPVICLSFLSSSHSTQFIRWQ